MADRRSQKMVENRSQIVKNRQAREAKRREKLGQSLGERPRHGPDPETAAALLFNETSVLDLINTGVVDDSVDLTAALQAGPALLQRAIGPERTALGVELARKKVFPIVEAKLRELVDDIMKDELANLNDFDDDSVEETGSEL